MFDIEWIQRKVKENKYYYSKHGDQERQNENLTLREVEEAILSGRIIEQYQDTGRGDSCLVIGFTEKGIPIHIVCGKRSDWLAVITIYIPLPPKFITPYDRGNR
ncbi:MAG: DUF4258 domain-containing protein [Nitrospirae bacterium]|nr:DUF4258 domain-containing protein [Nitrospirota bacterium]